MEWNSLGFGEDGLERGLASNLLEWLERGVFNDLEFP